MKLGVLLKKYREQNNFSMQDFAYKSGLSKGYISMLERGRHPQNNREIVPSIETVQKIATAMGLSIDELLESVDKNQLIDISHKNGSNLDGVTNISFPAAYSVPILGTICAGCGVWCDENYAGEFFIDQSIKADLCLKIKGDSMIDIGINDGDYAFIRKVYDYEGGKVYAVRINSDSEAVLKVVHWQGESVMLSPRNANYDPMIEPAENVSIIGECVGVYHTL